jgi:hypothetical protein
MERFNKIMTEPIENLINNKNSYSYGKIGGIHSKNSINAPNKRARTAVAKKQNNY